MTTFAYRALHRLDQGMAADAAHAVPQRVDDETLRRLRQLPSMLQISGLASTLTFLVAKGGGGDAMEQAYDDAAAALTRRIAVRLHLDPNTSPTTLLEHLVTLPVTDYQVASAEARAFASWLARVAEGRRR